MHTNKPEMYMEFGAIGMGHDSSFKIHGVLGHVEIVVLAWFTALQCLPKVLQPNMLCWLKLSTT